VTRLIVAAYAVALAAMLTPIASASGPLAIYGIVEKVVFEPDESTPERVQVWGAFAYAHVKYWNRRDGDPSPNLSTAQRGYLYFELPTDGRSVALVRNEWTDLRAVAGTGQAVGFGGWGHTGRFEALRPDAHNKTAYVLEGGPGEDQPTDLRVRPASETPAAPAAYVTNAGIVKLSAGGSHAAIVKHLRAALGR
jgi:hypothetical protein